MNKESIEKGSLLVLVENETKIPYSLEVVDNVTKGYFTTESSGLKWGYKGFKLGGASNQEINSFISYMKPVIFNEKIELDLNNYLEVDSKTFSLITKEEALEVGILSKELFKKIEKREEKFHVENTEKNIKESIKKVKKWYPGTKELRVEYDSGEGDLTLKFESPLTIHEMRGKIYNNFKSKYLDYVYEKNYEPFIKKDYEEIMKIKEKLQEKIEKYERKESELNVPVTKRKNVRKYISS